MRLDYQPDRVFSFRKNYSEFQKVHQSIKCTQISRSASASGARDGVYARLVAASLSDADARVNAEPAAAGE